MGEPSDVAGECNAHLYIGDNFGDNHATMRCQRPAGHEGEHMERFRGGDARALWLTDERKYEQECATCRHEDISHEFIDAPESESTVERHGKCDEEGCGCPMFTPRSKP